MVQDREGAELDAWLTALRTDWRTADLSDVDAALCRYAVKLTRTPAEMSEADIDELRAHELEDEAIHEAVQVVSYFNYINRLADAVRVDLEPEMEPYPH